MVIGFDERKDMENHLLPGSEILYENSAHMRDLLKENFGTDMEEDVVEEIIHGLKKTGSIKYCEKEIKRRVENAKSELHKIRDSEFRGYLSETPDFVLNYLEKRCIQLEY